MRTFGCAIKRQYDYRGTPLYPQSTPAEPRSWPSGSSAEFRAHRWLGRLGLCNKRLQEFRGWPSLRRLEIPVFVRAPNRLDVPAAQVGRAAVLAQFPLPAPHAAIRAGRAHDLSKDVRRT